GDGTIDAQKLSPADVSGLGSGIAGISAGSAHTCAMTEAGGAKCWGRAFEGQLGSGTDLLFDRRVPGDVVGLGSEVVSISVGGQRSCVLTDTAGVKCWGADYGTSPVDVTELAGESNSLSQGN